MDEQLRDLILLLRDQGRLGRTVGAITRQAVRAKARGELHVARTPRLTDVARVITELIEDHELGISRP